VSAPVYEFGGFTLDCERFELSRAGRILKLEKKPMELLILLASSSGRLVTRTEIAERLWKREVYVDTEHGTNTAIRKIRQVLRDDPEQPRFVQTVTGKGYRFIAPLAANTAPSGEEISPPAVTNAVADPPPQACHRQPIWLGSLGVAIGVVLVIALTLAARNRFANPKPKITSLAVLPLDNLSGEPGQDYFAEGMTDELITMLAKNSTLRIVSRTSAMQYKRAHRPLPEIAQRLGVEGILEGSIARSNNRVHMNVQLIDARSDTHLWAESFDRDTNESVSLSSEVAQSVARQLHSTVPQAAAARSVRSDAHDAYLHGRYLWFTNHNDQAGEYFLKATQLQPDYSLAWTGVADYYVAGAVEGQISPKESLGRAKAAARKAALLDDSLAQAHVSLGAVAFFADWDWPRALEECDRAIELDPKFAEAYHLKAKVLAALQRHDDAIQLERKAMELSPFARPWGLVLEFNWARQFDRAISEARARLESAPADGGLLWELAYAYRCKGVEAEAAKATENAFQAWGNPAVAAEAAEAFRQGGYRGVVQKRLDLWRRLSERHYVSPVTLAGLTAQLRGRERTLTLLEEGQEEHSPLLLDIQFDPAYDFLHSDERYRSIINKVGLPPAY
jgi:TolB-like protein/DNA-binding winged helix-turn-helix (wHTH) protein